MGPCRSAGRARGRDGSLRQPVWLGRSHEAVVTTPVPSDDQRQDFAALRERGILLTPSVRRLLWLAIDYHDITRDIWAAAILRSAEDPVRALRDALRAWIVAGDERARMDESHARYLHREEVALVRQHQGVDKRPGVQ